MAENKAFLRGKCKLMSYEYTDVLAALVEEVNSDIARESITGDSSFEYAKKVLRKEGIKEGLNLLIGKINKYASGS